MISNIRMNKIHKRSEISSLWLSRSRVSPTGVRERQVPGSIREAHFSKLF